MTTNDAPAAERDAPLAVVRPILGAILAGLAVGAVTQVLQGVLSGPLAWVANSLSAWLLAAFVAGTRMPGPRVAAVAGVALLYAALAGYYAAVEVRFGYGAGGSILVFWAIGALAGGVVFGPAGWIWRHGTERRRAAATGLVGALLVAEGVYLLTILPDPASGIGAIVAGCVAPAVLGGTGRGRALAYLALLPWLLLAAAGYAAMLVLYGLITG